jgi:VanZ family protein
VRRLLVVVIALIVYGSLYPWDFQFRPGINPLDFLLHSWVFRWDRFALRDIAVNLALYMPLGAAAALSPARRHGRALSLASAALLGMALSVSIEVLQIYIPPRACSLLDVASNTAGSVLGGLTVLTLWPAPGAASPLHISSGRRAPAAVFLLACWAGYQLYPALPILSRTRLRAGLALLYHASGVSPVEIWAGAAEWLAAAMLMRVLLGRLRRPWLALAMVCLPVRILIAGRVLSIDEVLGAAAALLLWPAVDSAFGKRGGPVLGAVALGSAIVLRELEPFRFSAHAAAVSWVPFAAALESARQPGALVVLRKVFEYGAEVWLLRLAGWPYGYAGAAVTFALAVLEVVQRYLPGRTPETTDAVMSLLAAFVLWRLDSTGRARAR